MPGAGCCAVFKFLDVAAGAGLANLYGLDQEIKSCWFMKLHMLQES